MIEERGGMYSCCKRKASRKFANSNVIYVLCMYVPIRRLTPLALASAKIMLRELAD